MKLPAIAVFILFNLQLLVSVQANQSEDLTAADKLIKIGFLIQDRNSLDALNGAKLAIQFANEQGGFNGSKFQLITRSMEGPWGTGSKEAVNLIFSEKVYGLIGSHDGRNAHLVEQVCAKSHVNFMSARASDPTLSQAFVPWFFNCVPNDLQQSASLIKEIYQKEKLEKIAIISENSYDNNSFVKYLLKDIKANGFKEPLKYSSGNTKIEIENAVNFVRKENLQSLVLSGSSDFSKNFIQMLRLKGMNQTIFCPLFSIDKRTADLPKVNLVELSSSFDRRPEAKIFLMDFKKNYEKNPSEESAYAFDAVTIMITAIRNCGGDRDKIRDELMKINYKGVTGIIHFDENGNRMGEPQVVVLNR